MLRRLVREPFLHFLVLGALIYGGVELARAPADQYRIVVGQEQVQHLAATYAKQFGAQPTAVELKALVTAYIDEEIFYREGVALRLADDDEIVRRRVAQKYEFLQQDLDMVADPTRADLDAFFAQHQDAYRIPAQVSFTHIFFSPDRGGVDGAKARAAVALRTLGAANQDRAPELGDPFPDLYDYASLDKIGIERLFGENDFADQLLAAPVGAWAGPYRSGYGWHLVRVTARTAPSLPNLTDIEDRVRVDYLDHMRGERQAKALEQLRKKYRIVSDDGQNG